MNFVIFFFLLYILFTAYIEHKKNLQRRKELEEELRQEQLNEALSTSSKKGSEASYAHDRESRYQRESIEDRSPSFTYKQQERESRDYSRESAKSIDYVEKVGPLITKEYSLKDTEEIRNQNLSEMTPKPVKHFNVKKTRDIKESRLQGRQEEYQTMSRKNTQSHIWSSELKNKILHHEIFSSCRALNMHRFKNW